jgi:hypothetical protein
LPACRLEQLNQLNGSPEIQMDYFTRAIESLLAQGTGLDDSSLKLDESYWARAPLAIAWLFSEANWRGLSTLRQVTTPPAHIQTLTWKWWTSIPEGLRIGSADHLLESLKERVGNLYRFWECVARRMVIYEFYFLDPRLISIVFEPPARKKRGKSANN